MNKKKNTYCMRVIVGEDYEFVEANSVDDAQKELLISLERKLKAKGIHNVFPNLRFRYDDTFPSGATPEDKQVFINTKLTNKFRHVTGVSSAQQMNNAQLVMFLTEMNSIDGNVHHEIMKECKRRGIFNPKAGEDMQDSCRNDHYECGCGQCARWRADHGIHESDCDCSDCMGDDDL